MNQLNKIKQQIKDFSKLEDFKINNNCINYALYLYDKLYNINNNIRFFCTPMFDGNIQIESDELEIIVKPDGSLSVLYDLNRFIDIIDFDNINDFFFNKIINIILCRK